MPSGNLLNNLMAELRNVPLCQCTFNQWCLKMIFLPCMCILYRKISFKIRRITNQEITSILWQLSVKKINTYHHKVWTQGQVYINSLTSNQENVDIEQSSQKEICTNILQLSYIFHLLIGGSALSWCGGLSTPVTLRAMPAVA
jgi:hypothetical protein